MKAREIIDRRLRVEPDGPDGAGTSSDAIRPWRHLALGTAGAVTLFAAVLVVGTIGGYGGRRAG